MRYRNLDTGEVWTAEEIEKEFNNFRHEMEGWEEKSFDEYMEHLLDLGKQGSGGMVEAPWYAVLKDREDTDHGYGSFNLDEAKKMARNMDSQESYIAIIDDEDDFCLGEISHEDIFDGSYTVYWTGGENDGKTIAGFDSEAEAIKFAKDFYKQHEDEFDPVCGGVGIADPNGDIVADW